MLNKMLIALALVALCPTPLCADAIRSDALPDLSELVAPASLLARSCLAKGARCEPHPGVLGFKGEEVYVLLDSPWRLLSVAQSETATTLDESVALPVCEAGDSTKKCAKKLRKMAKRLDKKGVRAARATPRAVRDNVALLGGSLPGWYLSLSTRNSTLRASLVDPLNRRAERLFKSAGDDDIVPRIVDVTLRSDEVVVLWRDGVDGPLRMASAVTPDAVDSAEASLTRDWSERGLVAASENGERVVVVRHKESHSGAVTLRVQLLEAGTDTPLWEDFYRLEEGDPPGVAAAERVRIQMVRNGMTQVLHPPVVLEEVLILGDLVLRVDAGVADDDDIDSPRYALRVERGGEVLDRATIESRFSYTLDRFDVWVRPSTIVVRGVSADRETPRSHYAVMEAEGELCGVLATDQAAALEQWNQTLTPEQAWTPTQVAEHENLSIDFFSCHPAASGAWGVVLDELSYVDDQFLQGDYHFALVRPDGGKSVSEKRSFIADSDWNSDSMASPVLTDVDGDGREELVVSGQRDDQEGSSTWLAVYRQNGDELENHQSMDDVIARVEDIDDDGLPDYWTPVLSIDCETCLDHEFENMPTFDIPKHLGPDGFTFDDTAKEVFVEHCGKPATKARHLLKGLDTESTHELVPGIAHRLMCARVAGISADVLNGFVGELCADDPRVCEFAEYFEVWVAQEPPLQLEQ